MIPLPVTATRRWRRWLGRILLLALLVAVFAAGIALGMALHDNPQPGPALTVERTIELPAAPGH